MIPSTIALINPDKATVYWYVARGSGFVVYGLLTAAVVLGILLSLRWRSDAWPRFITQKLHPFILLVAGVFLTLHVVSVLLDTFIRFQLYQVLIPFTSSYRVIWLSLGIVAMYLGIALAISTYLRPLIGYRLWRSLHYGGFLAWLLALAHGLATGTDSKATWATALYAGSAILVAGLLAVRFGGVPIPLGRPPRFRGRVVLSLAGALLLGGYFASSGPWANGWADRAQGMPFHSTNTTATKPVAAIVPVTLHQPITGTAQTETSDAVQQGSGVLRMRLRSSGSYPMTLSYALLLVAAQGGAQFVHGVFSAAPTTLAWNCSGTVSFQPPDMLDSTCTLPGNRTMQLKTRFQIDQSGTVSGELRTSATAGSNGQVGG